MRGLLAQNETAPPASNLQVILASDEPVIGRHAPALPSGWRFRSGSRQPDSAASRLGLVRAILGAAGLETSEPADRRAQ